MQWRVVYGWSMYGFYLCVGVLIYPGKPYRVKPVQAPVQAPAQAHERRSIQMLAQFRAATGATPAQAQGPAQHWPVCIQQQQAHVVFACSV